MTRLRYSRASLGADYLRAGAGAALTLGPLAAIPVWSVPGAVLGGLGLLFVAFGGRTWLRQRCEIVLTEDGVTIVGLRTRSVAWPDLTGVALRYYTTKRDRSRGWMQLTLAGNGATLRLESTLDRFDLVAKVAARAAAAKGIALSPSTVDNLRALGVPARDIAPAQSAETLAGIP